MRWDLSPQGNRELLVTFLSVAFHTDDSPDIYTYDNVVSESGDVVVFNFVLPVKQCPSKEARNVALKIREQLDVVGLKPDTLTCNGDKRVFVTTDGGSENKPAMELLFGIGNYIPVYCAAHALSLVFVHAVEDLPGRSKTKPRSTMMTHW